MVPLRVVWVGVVLLLGTILPSSCEVENQRPIPEDARAFRDYVRLLWGGRVSDAALYSDENVNLCANFIFRDEVEPIYEDQEGYPPGADPVDYITDMAMNRYPLLMAFTACLLHSTKFSQSPPLHENGLPHTFKTAAGPLVFVAATSVGMTPAAQDLLQAILLNYPVAVNSTISSITTPLIVKPHGTESDTGGRDASKGERGHDEMDDEEIEDEDEEGFDDDMDEEEAADGVQHTYAATHLRTIGYGLFHKAFDSDKLLFRDAINSVLREEHFKKYSELIVNVGTYIKEEVPRDTPNRSGYVSALNKAIRRIQGPEVRSKDKILIGRTLYVSDLHLVAEGLSLILVDSLIPATDDRIQGCGINDIMVPMLRYDEFGRNALHMAAFKSKLATALMLFRLRVWFTKRSCPVFAANFLAALQKKDVFGITPMDIWLEDRGIFPELQKFLKQFGGDHLLQEGESSQRQPSSPLELTAPSKPQTDGHAWPAPAHISREVVSALHFLQNHSGRCDFDVLDGEKLTENEVRSLFLRRYFAHNRPVLIRGGAKAWTVRQTLGFPSMLRHHGKVELDVGEIPYSEFFESKSTKWPFAKYALAALYCTPHGVFGEEVTSEWKSTPEVQDVLASPKEERQLCKIYNELARAGRNASAAYVFTRLAGDRSGGAAALLKRLTLFPTLLNSSIPVMEDNGANTGLAVDAEGETHDQQTIREVPLVVTYPEVRDPQFFFGVPGTGAPPHYHEDAINILAHGRKEWMLFPPSEAMYSTVPGLDFVLHVLPDLLNAPNHIQRCTQEAGDILYIPNAWGHAVFNTLTSIGYAVEFPTAWRY